MLNRREREELLIKEIEREMPGFAASCRNPDTLLLLHQDAFAADYQDHDYIWLGKAIKFAGIYSKEIHIIGKNCSKQ